MSNELKTEKSEMIAKKLVRDWEEMTYDDRGNVLTYEDSRGYREEYTYDENDNVLTYKDSEGFSSERTYDDQGILLTYKSFDGFYFQ